MRGPRSILRRYERFEAALPHVAAELERDEEGLTFIDRTEIIRFWLNENAPEG